MKIDNLYQHADGGMYCLLSDDAPMKHPSTGEWIPGVVYIGSEDEKIRSTSTERWAERFERVAEYTGNDESVLAMIRRANPGEQNFDFIRTMESWHEAEMGVTGHMIELAVAAAMVSYIWGLSETSFDKYDNSGRVKSATLTIKTQDLQQVLQNYEIERVPEPHGFRFTVSKEIISKG